MFYKVEDILIGKTFLINTKYIQLIMEGDEDTYAGVSVDGKTGWITISNSCFSDIMENLKASGLMTGVLE